jgi:hypothetical protein
MMKTCMSRVTGSSPALALMIKFLSVLFFLSSASVGGADCPRL